LLLTHASPNDRLRRWRDLDDIDMSPARNNAYQNELLETFMWHYGQSAQVTSALMETVSRSAVPVRVLVHGHEREPDGWYSEHDAHLCPVIFGAPDSNKRCLIVPANASVMDAKQLLRDGMLCRFRLDPATP